MLRTHGRLGLAEHVLFGKETRLRYEIGDGDSCLEISDSGFTRGELVPGRVWVEIGNLIMTIERRHFRPVLSGADG